MGAWTAEPARPRPGCARASRRTRTPTEEAEGPHGRALDDGGEVDAVCEGAEFLLGRAAATVASRASGIGDPPPVEDSHRGGKLDDLDRLCAGVARVDLDPGDPVEGRSGAHPARGELHHGRAIAPEGAAAPLDQIRSLDHGHRRRGVRAGHDSFRDHPGKGHHQQVGAPLGSL